MTEPSDVTNPEPRDLISHYEREIRRIRDMYDRNAADLARRQADASSRSAADRLDMSNVTLDAGE